MWRSISSSCFGLKKNADKVIRTCEYSSDDESISNASTEEGLECLICMESFNIVENVPYVLWCGHTLCKNCILGLRWTSVKFSAQQIQIPFFISCPWCNLWTFRLVYGGNLTFPSKNFFLLWMVESRNGDRMKSRGDRQSLWSPKCTPVMWNNSNTANRRSCGLSHSGSNQNDSNHENGRFTSERLQLSLHKSLDFFIHITLKFPLVIFLLLIAVFAVPASLAILMLYLVITVVFALPAFLVLYFAYPALNWLRREIRS